MTYKHSLRILALSLAVLAILFQDNASAQQKRVFMAPDDHTDYFWSATADEYRNLFISMIDYYLNQADATANEPSEHQSRFSADGSLWLYEYEKNKTPGDFQRVVDRLKSGHLSAPLNPLVITYGGVPAEAVIRSMYYGGQLERRYGLDFPMAIAMENAGMPYGLGSLWAGSGAEYSWQGVCNCPSLIANLDRREREIYRWLGPDGSSILMKWNSLHDANNNQSVGGYAEARFPGTALDLVTTQAASNGFASRYPYNTIGVFGQGWDDLSTTNLNVQQTCKSRTDGSRLCIVSNMIDFFKEFELRYASGLPTVSASFGNEWDLSPASLSEASARIKRSLEKLRSAEALATLVSLKNPSFLNGREAARDKAFLNLGLYFEHDFENGGPRVPGSVRIAWQRQVAGEVEAYVNTLMADAGNALGSMIATDSANPRFFVFNPLGWDRFDIADLPYSGALPAHVIDVSEGVEVPSQSVTVNGTRFLRIQAPAIPSVGYKVFEVRQGSGQSFADAPIANAATGVMENEFVRITVSPRGAVTSFIDKRLGNREFAGTTGGFALNDLGPGTGTLQIENAGPVSVTLVASSANPLPHVTRITLSRGSDRVAIQNEVTQNFGGTQRWRFSVNVTSPDVHHEEVGAILRARLTNNGGHYSPTNARYDFLTLNHFADMSGAGSVGLSLSNADAYFMTVGASTVTNLDTATPQFSVVLGTSARPSNPILNQAGDSYFLQRFALRSHGPYDPTAAMRFALEHQNPLAAGAVSGGDHYPADSFSYLSISDPNVFLWALKPAEEGIGEGVIARVWNLASTPTNFLLALDEPIASAKKIWHIETDQGEGPVTSGVLNAPIAQNQLLSFRLFPGSFPPGVKILPSDARAAETGDPGSFTIVRTGDLSSPLDVTYTVGGTAIPGTDYQPLSGTATIPAGSAGVTVPVLPINDAVSEPTESISVKLTPQANYLLGVWTSATVSLINGPSAPPPPPPAGSVRIEYPFAEGSGGTTADVSESQTATLANGAAWIAAGRYGSAIAFDGADDHLSVPDHPSLDLGGAGTLSAWVKLDTLNRWHGVIAKGNANSNSGHNYAMEVDNTNRWACILGNGSSSLLLRSTVAPAVNQFIHVACVWNGSTLQLYINGALNASTSLALVPSGNSAPLYIGQFGGNVDRLDGVIDEVRIYNKALTAAEIQSDMNTPISAAPDTTPPVITSGPNAVNTTPSGTTITWTTNEPSDSRVEYGLSASFGSATPLNANLVTSHSETLSGLSSGTTYYYRVLSKDGSGNPVASSEASFTTPSSDTIPPTVSITSPTDGATVSGTITVTANASDNAGVAGVQFKLDGANLGGEDTSAPYSSTWDTTVVANGTYLLSAVARDAEGNIGTNPGVSVTVDNSAPPSTPPPSPAPSGLKAAYSFQEGAGTVAADGSGNGNGGTLINGPAWTSAGRYGSAIAFDGADDHLSVPDHPSLDLGGAGTIEAWIKLDTLNRWHGVIAKGNANSDAVHNYALEVKNTNRWICILGNGSSKILVQSTVAPVVNQFIHVACAWNGTSLQLYINGALNASTPQSLTPAANAAPLYIGQFGGNADRLDGVVDEVRIYNRALSSAEIQNDMNTPQ